MIVSAFSNQIIVILSKQIWELSKAVAAAMASKARAVSTRNTCLSKTLVSTNISVKHNWSNHRSVVVSKMRLRQ